VKKRGTLESRVCLLIAALLFVLFLAVGCVLSMTHREALMADKLEEYQALSGMLSLTSAPLANTYDVGLYHEFTTRFMRADSDISYVVLSNSKGRVLYSRSRRAVPTNERSFVGGQAGRPTEFVNRLASADEKECARYRIPVMVKSGEHGYITVGFGSRSVDSAMDNLKAALLGTFGMALAMGLLGAIFVAKAAASPLKRLISAARAVAAGNLETSVPVSSDDEAGELAETFNSMVVALRENQDKLIERANRDSLTGLSNHRYFQETLRSEIKRAERYGRAVSVIMLDIDDFKTLNDTHGHLAGDKVLEDMAHVLVGGTRVDIDLVARYGGEEFAIILPETDAKAAGYLAERIRKSVKNHIFIGEGGGELKVTISLGVAQTPVHASNAEGLVMAADLALYRSKALGKDRVTVFSPDAMEDLNQDPYRLHMLLNAEDIGTIEAMAAAVDAKGRRSPDFSQAIMSHAVAVACDLGMSENQQKNVRIAALLHDIGKLAVPNEVLNKKGALDDREVETIKRHPTLGYAIVQKSPHLKSMLPGILHHHERWDGGGYPEGLKGEQIPLVARVIAVIDAYHAMMTERPHSIAMTPDQAKEELRRSAGTQFDPRIVDAFLRILSREGAEKEAA